MPRRLPRTTSLRSTKSTETVIHSGVLAVVLGFLMIAVLDIALCELEETTQPSKLCTFCDWTLKHPDRFRPGCSGEFGPANRVCPTCNRQWGDFDPYYLEWLRGPIRSAFGRLHF